jgi:hypothetical protein
MPSHRTAALSTLGGTRNLPWLPIWQATFQTSIHPAISLESQLSYDDFSLDILSNHTSHKKFKPKELK